MVISGDYVIREVNGTATAEVLRYLNSKAPDRFPPLEPRHLEQGHWWLVRTWERSIVGFAGMVPMIPFQHTGYLKRAYILPEHRGKGLQIKLMRLREAKARDLGWTTLVGECSQNPPSEANFIKAGFEVCDPEQKWGAAGSIYFVKRL
jgi:GNAT superfamily N-acetyltransferase